MSERSSNSIRKPKRGAMCIHTMRRMMCFLCAIPLVLNIACGSDDGGTSPVEDDGPVLTNEIWPMGIGYVWYGRHQRDNDGDGVFDQTFEDEWFSIGASVDFHGEEWFSYAGTTYPLYYRKNRDDGLWWTIHLDGDQTDPDNYEEHLFLPYPCQTGDDNGRSDYRRVVVLGVGVPVEVPAGTFECVKYRWAEGPREVFCAPGIGIVKELVYQEGALLIQRELTGVNFLD